MFMDKKKLRRLRFSFIIFFAVSIGLAGFVGYEIGRGKKTTAASSDFVNTNLGSNEIGNIDFKLFWEALTKLKENYVSDVDLQKYLYGAISGGFASLGDPYTNFLSPEVSQDFEDELTGQLEGIGIRIGSLDGYPAVIAPLNDSPAQKVGLKPKDLIVKIDDKDAAGMTTDEAVELIRGAARTEVRLEVLRSGENKTREFKIVRENIDVKTVEVKQIQDGISLIEINEFGTSTTSDFIVAAQKLKDDNVGKIIIDLRNNPGGLLNSAIEIAGEIFDDDKLVVIEEGKTGRKESKTSGTSLLKDAKIAVLVNGGSASAAEILAGAIGDNDRGVVIGEKTFGKGTVQQLESLTGGSSVKITIAKWLTPNGNSIDKNGIQPDIEVKEPDDILFAKDDPLIDRAVQELGK